MAISREETGELWHEFFNKACKQFPYQEGYDPRILAMQRQEALVDMLLEEVFMHRKKEIEDGQG